MSLDLKEQKVLIQCLKAAVPDLRGTGDRGSRENLRPDDLRRS